MPGDHRATTNHNLEILLSAGFKKQGNTSIFKKSGCNLLSPAVSCGQGGHYWFDIRQVNVDKVQGGNSHILIRIIPDMFILLDLTDFSTLLSEATKRFRKNSGFVWGFYISLNTILSKAKIVSSADSSLSHSVSILEKNRVQELLKTICGQGDAHENMRCITY